MKKFFKNLIVNIEILLEIFKSFIIMCLVIVAIISSLSAIIHNVLKIREIYQEDNSGYKQLVNVDKNRMNIQILGNGEKTAVILSDFGTSSPIIQYKAYANRLVSNGYKVAIIEYFGYGYSLSTNTTRTADNFVKEINEVLQVSGITEPYMILANGTSGLYAMNYLRKYPYEVSSLILVDSIYPNTIDEEYIQKKISNENFNIQLTSFAELTGYARICSYIYPKLFSIDKMKKLGYSNTDISVYRKMIANRFYTATMKNEYKLLPDNMVLLKNYKLPEYLRVTQILSNEYIKEYKNYQKNKLIEKNIEEYANDIITNTDIQKIVTVDGEKGNLNLSNPDKVMEVLGF